MVLKATFNNISVISWQSVLLVKKTTQPETFIVNSVHMLVNGSGWN